MMRRVLPLMLLIVVTNMVMLGSVLANRAGEPNATLLLMERELHLERGSDRDSSQKLRLWTQAWRSYPTDSSAEKWLTRDKLATLGFLCRTSVDKPPAQRPCGLPRRAFVVYEYDGPSWQIYSAELQRAASPGWTPEIKRNEVRYGSRLIALDAALDPAALRRAYPDERRHLILAVNISAWLTVSQQSTAPVVSSRIEPLTTTLIVPLRFRDRLSTLAPSDWLLSKEPRYAVKVAVGRHLEPWILAIDPIDTVAAPH
jgi:hypothetical protein